MIQSDKNILITGGVGFIGSHLVRLFVKKYPNYQIYNLDSLSYAGNLANLSDIENSPNYHFVKGDICDPTLLDKLFLKHKFDGVIHLAAESHVDRSISDPFVFLKTNFMGTANLLHVAEKYWRNSKKQHRFHHVSTDEVYGSLAMDDSLFVESTSYDPRSPYSASKASSDHLVRAWAHTYGLPVVVTNCSNNYGPYQFPEKLIPLFINNIIHYKKLPVYGAGINVRDWLYVEDHAEALDLVYHEGKNLETYNIGGHNEWKNIDLIHLLCDLMDSKLNRPQGSSRELITFVTDRSGHDLRYAIDASKIQNELGWKPSLQFEKGIDKTIDWYLTNSAWLESVTSGAYKNYYKNQYKEHK